MQDLWTGFALVLVVEGVLYALFPGPMQRMMQRAVTMPPSALRGGGLGAAALGVVLVWLIRG